MDISTSILEYKEFNDNMIKFLNSHPLYTFGMFKKYVVKFLKYNEINFPIKANTLSNIYYSWRKNSKILSQYSIYDNNLTNDNKEYLRDIENILLYEPDGKKLYWNSHIIWISPFFIKRIIKAPCVYIDGTYLSTQEYYQLLVLIFFDEFTNKKYLEHIFYAIINLKNHMLKFYKN